MKNLIILITLVSSLNAFGGTIQCAKIGSHLRPVSESAVLLANELKLTTCKSENFQLAVSAMGQKIEIVRATKEQRQNYYNSKKEALLKKLRAKGLVQ